MNGEIKNLTGLLNSGQALFAFNGSNRGGVVQTSVRVHEGATWMHDQLTEVETETIERLYEPQDGLLLTPVRDNLAWGIKKVKGYLTESGGKPTLVQGVNPDLGKASIGGSEMTDNAFTVAFGYDIDMDELAANRNRASDPWDRVASLDTACERGLNEYVDEVLSSGDPAAGIRALFADKTTGEGTYKLPGAGGGVFLTTSDGTIVHLTTSSTPDELAEYLMFALDRIFEKTKKQIRPNRLALPLRLYTLIGRKRMTDGGQSVLHYIAENSKWLSSVDDVIGCPFLEGFFPARGKTPARDAIVAYRYDDTVVRARILTPRRHSVQQFSFGQCVIWAARFHSPMWWRPLGCLIFENDWTATS